MRNFDLAQLRSFVAIAEHRTFLAASRKVARTQSAITQQIQKLEQAVGAELFEREGRTKRLTAFGEHFLDYARHLIAINDETWRAIRERDVLGSIRFGAPQDAADTILPRVLAAIARAFPRLRVEIHVDRSPILMEQLHQGALDLTLTTRGFEEGTVSVVVRTSPTVWICGASYAHAAGTVVPLVIADERSLFRSIALESLNAAGIPWRTAHLAPHLVGIKAAIRAGLGITARSVEMLDAEMRVLGAAEGLPILRDVKYSLAMRRDQRSEIAQAIYDLVITTFGLRTGT